MEGCCYEEHNGEYDGSRHRRFVVVEFKFRRHLRGWSETLDLRSSGFSFQTGISSGQYIQPMRARVSAMEFITISKEAVWQLIYMCDFRVKSVQVGGFR
jgi:hypothetical protein